MKRRVYASLFILGIVSCVEETAETIPDPPLSTISASPTSPRVDNFCSPSKCDSESHCSQLITRESQAIQSGKRSNRICQNLYFDWYQYYKSGGR